MQVAARQAATARMDAVRSAGMGTGTGARVSVVAALVKTAQPYPKTPPRAEAIRP